MSPYLTPSLERAVIQPNRRALLQIALIAPFALPYRARAAGAQSTALDPIVTLNSGLLAVMKAGNAVHLQNVTTLCLGSWKIRSTCRKSCAVA